MFREATQPAFCAKGHEQTPENVYPHRVSGKIYPCCRECDRESKRRHARIKRERAALKELLTPPSRPMALAEPTGPVTPQHEAWMARKRRERVGLPLRQCDLEQASEQLEDMGGL
jgi:hypothetical protein